ncbi:MAG TPA: GNAT family N-acetyltransferase [Pseudonocardiaceae bacterium]
MTPESPATVPAVIRLRTGEELAVRPIAPEDAAALNAAFLRLGADSRYQRFQAGVPVLSRAWLDHLTRVDHRDHEALVALAPGGDAIVGVARYIRSPAEPAAAEVAVTVADEWHGRGLGRRLLEALARHAVRIGITTFTASVSPSNRVVHRLLGSVGAVTGRDGGFVVRLTAAPAPAATPPCPVGPPRR